jgi:hypothetical protein
MSNYLETTMIAIKTKILLLLSFMTLTLLPVEWTNGPLVALSASCLFLAATMSQLEK